MSLRYLLRKRGTTECTDSHRKRNGRGDHLRHATQRVVLDPFGRADEQHARVQVLTHRAKQMPRVMRRHYADYNPGAAQRLSEIVGRANGCGDYLSGKKKFVDVPRIDALTNFRFMRPKSDIVRPLASEHDGDGRAPCASSDDRDFAHSITISDSRGPRAAFECSFCAAQ